MIIFLTKKTWLILTSILLIIIFILLIISSKKESYKLLSNPVPSPSKTPAFLSPLPSFTELIDDPQIGNEFKNAYQKYPWLEKLPIKTESAYIIYDWQKEAIKIILIIKQKPSLTYEQAVNQAKNDALSELKKIGVDLLQTAYYFTFNP